MKEFFVEFRTALDEIAINFYFSLFLVTIIMMMKMKKLKFNLKNFKK